MKRFTNLRHVIGHMKHPNFLTFVSASALILLFRQTVRLNFRIELNVKLNLFTLRTSSNFDRNIETGKASANIGNGKTLF